MTALPLPKAADDAEFAGLVAAARAAESSPDEVARLALHLAQSGEMMVWPGDDIADVASTGGPGSMSTLVAPLALRAREFRVVKLAVPGRPAGAIDSLGTLDGYRTQSSAAEVRAAVERCGFAHFLADNRFAPLDAALFKYRRRHGAVAVPMLAASSLLAKKLAVGVRRVGLDVRLGEHANFGATAAEARANARLFCEAARSLGIAATAFLSDGPSPRQPWIGRGESLVALACAIGLLEVEDSGGWLAQHVAECCRMADEAACTDLPHDQVSAHALQQALHEHLLAHGTNLQVLQARAKAVLAAPNAVIEASMAGVLSIDLGALRDAVVDLQADVGHGLFRDPAGIRCLSKPGDLVAKGEPLVRIRHECDPAHAESLLAQVNAAFRVLPEGRPADSLSDAPRPGGIAMEVIRA